MTIAPRPHPRPRGAPPTLALAALLLAACSPPKIDQVEDTMKSWTASAQLAQELRQQGAVTDRYVRQIHDGAEQALTESKKNIAKAAKTASDSAEALSAADELAHAVKDLEGGG